MYSKKEVPAPALFVPVCCQAFTRNRAYGLLGATLRHNPHNLFIFIAELLPHGLHTRCVCAPYTPRVSAATPRKTNQWGIIELVCAHDPDGNTHTGFLQTKQGAKQLFSICRDLLHSKVTSDIRLVKKGRSRSGRLLHISKQRAKFGGGAGGG